MCQVQEPLEAAIAILHSPVENLSNDEWSVLKELVLVFRPFTQLTVELSAEKNVSVSKVIVMIKCLKMNIDSLQVKTNTAKEVIQKLSNEIAIKFKDVEYYSVFSRATFLDPRFKQHGFFNEDASRKVRDIITTDISKMNTNEPRSSNEVRNNSTVESSSMKGIWQYFDHKLKNSTDHSTKTSTSVIEVRKYMEEKNLEREENPLKFWAEKEIFFPYLSKLAKKYLSMQATSVASERLFSKAGLLIVEKRSRLDSKTAEKILFLNGNQKYISN